RRRKSSTNGNGSTGCKSTCIIRDIKPHRMMYTLMPYAARLIQAIGWSLLHSLWQGAVIWLVLTAVFRAFPAMSARLKHGCALMGLLLLTLWVTNTAVTQWQQLHTVAVRVIPGNAANAAGYVIEVPPQVPGFSSVM